jgi:hypothetical protein
MYIAMDAGKAFGKSLHAFLMNISSLIGKEGNFLCLTKSIVKSYRKHILCQKIKCFSLPIGRMTLVTLHYSSSKP